MEMHTLDITEKYVSFREIPGPVPGKVFNVG